MSHSPTASLPGRAADTLVMALVLLGTAGCALRGAQEPTTAPLQFVADVREVLNVGRPSIEFYDMRARLASMGPEVDAVLVGMVNDRAEKTIVRANAITLLAERQSPITLTVLGRVLLTEDAEMLRSAAVLGLQRLSASEPGARRLIRAAVSDPARTVRLNALQSLDIADAAALRRLLDTETDREVRTIAAQLVALAESRGAPVGVDRHGALRTAALEGEPAIVFRPFRTDSVRATARGDLRVELPDGPAVPLTPEAEVVAGVVPAFFSPNRSHVVYEAGRKIYVVDLDSRERHLVGAGIAPRPIPLSDAFVFLQQRSQQPTAAGGAEIAYRVLQADFGDSAVRTVGTLAATTTPERHANYSPARWMVVAETPAGFVLRGETITEFALPRGAPLTDSTTSDEDDTP